MKYPHSKQLFFKLILFSSRASSMAEDVITQQLAKRQVAEHVYAQQMQNAQNAQV